MIGDFFLAGAALGAAVLGFVLVFAAAFGLGWLLLVAGLVCRGWWEAWLDRRAERRLAAAPDPTPGPGFVAPTMAVDAYAALPDDDDAAHASAAHWSVWVHDKDNPADGRTVAVCGRLVASGDNMPLRARCSRLLNHRGACDSEANGKY